MCAVYSRVSGGFTLLGVSSFANAWLPSVRGPGYYNSGSTATRGHGSLDVSFTLCTMLIIIWSYLQHDKTCRLQASPKKSLVDVIH